MVGPYWTPTGRLTGKPDAADTKAEDDGLAFRF